MGKKNRDLKLRRKSEREAKDLENKLFDQIGEEHKIENLGRTLFISAGTLQSISAFTNAFNNAAKDPQGIYHGLENNYGLIAMLGLYFPYAYLQIQMRRHIKKEKTELKTDNAWSIIRNPIYAGMRLMSLSMFAAGPSVLNAAGGLGVFIGTEISARAEERKLELYFNNKYRDYVSRVPRWIPNLRYKQ